jgi:hypothetical protein
VPGGKATVQIYHGNGTVKAVDRRRHVGHPSCGGGSPSRPVLDEHAVEENPVTTLRRYDITAQCYDVMSYEPPCTAWVAKPVSPRWACIP